LPAKEKELSTATRTIRTNDFWKLRNSSAGNEDDCFHIEIIDDWSALSHPFPTCAISPVR
jgi:hypothetical protein